ncbi:hypothetical protein BDV29DRAFT_177081 [Aspergillus leporis]|uniref:Uncharacterized protein n=1 Tax=Aspergillus leporis TaxID=41062 RepID=A0A5N5WVL9_9EURO|nr:hypothetical protein BDV29DRAFT_177081 [Aspergillus leporis]
MSMITTIFLASPPAHLYDLRGIVSCYETHGLNFHCPMVTGYHDATVIGSDAHDQRQECSSSTLKQRKQCMYASSRCQ